MTKNIIVTDKFGNEIGSTYPKRAKGLVKNGRAEYTDGCETKIRLLNTHARPDKTEDNDMSNVINFNARLFKFDETCETKTGSHMMITDSLGKMCEQFEIGDYDWTWTQIACEMTLEPESDYIFRFAMTGGINDDGEEVSQFILLPRSDGKEIADDWDDRIIYRLDKSMLAPVLSKKNNDTLLRVYEIPFNTGANTKFRFVFVAIHAPASFMAAYDIGDYAQLDDLSYKDFMAAREESSEQADETEDKIKINLTNSHISADALALLLANRKKIDRINLTNAYIGAASNSGEPEKVGADDEDLETDDEGSETCEDSIEQDIKTGIINALTAVRDKLEAEVPELKDSYISTMKSIEERLEKHGFSFDSFPKSDKKETAGYSDPFEQAVETIDADFVENKTDTAE